MSLPVTTGLTLWLDAAQESYANNATGLTISDRSGNGRTITTTSGITFKTNAVNGKPAFLLNGSSDDIRTSSVQVGTVLVVAYYSLATAADYDGLFGSISTGRLIMTLNATVNYFYDPGDSTLTNSVNGVANTSYSLPVTQRWISAVTTDTTLESATRGIGTDRGNPGRQWHGYIAEVIAFNRVLSTTEINRLGGYVVTKYGIPVSHATLDTIGSIFRSGIIQ